MNQPDADDVPEENREPIDLTQFDDDFAQAPLEEREFEPVPDGKYQVSVEKAEIVRAKRSGNPMLKWTLKILGPRCAGRLLWRHNVLVTRENLKWLKSDLHMCGLDLTKLSDLQGNLPRLLDLKLEVTKRTKGTGEDRSESVYFNRRIQMDGPAAGQDAGGRSLVDEALGRF